MNIRVVSILFVLVSGACCAIAEDQSMPVTVDEYEANASGFPTQTIRLFNMRRVLDESLSTEQRRESLKLAMHLVGNDPEGVKSMLTLLAQTDLRTELTPEGLDVLLKSDQPNTAPYVLRALSVLPPGHLRDAVFDWLARNARADITESIIKAWAIEPVNGPDEEQYRRVISRATGLNWPEALLEGINAPSFFARGSSMSLLAGRFDVEKLDEILENIEPRTEAMAALQAAVRQVKYVPSNGSELLSTVMVYRSRGGTLEAATELNELWRTEYGYRFNIRDFHLLSHITDGFRRMLTRDELEGILGRQTSGRLHVPASSGVIDSFASQVDLLSVADLWNIYLIDHMVRRPKVVGALRVLARNPAEERTTVGGLVVYKNGRAEPILYEPARRMRGDEFYPTQRLLDDSRDSMCRFVIRFGDDFEGVTIGPGLEDLSSAARGNFYGLVLTLAGDSELCAHYYNPHGIVISLGRFLLDR